MKLFKHNLYNNYEAGIKIASRIAEFAITRNQFKPTGGDVDYELYTLPNILKLEITVGKEAFKFGWERHLHVTSTFSDAMSWFYDDKKKDLFYKSEEGTLFFNNDYNNLKASAYSGKATHQFLEIKPAIVERSFTHYEGVVIMLNETQAFANVTVSELAEISSVLTTFNFSSELGMFFEMAKGLDGIKITNSNIGG